MDDQAISPSAPAVRVRQRSRPALEERIRTAESELFAAARLDVDELFVGLPRTGLRLRALQHGDGPPLVLLHGVSLSAAVWAPLFSALPGHRLIAVDLPGHGLSDPVTHARGEVRAHAGRLMEDIADALGLDRVAVVGHSLGAMFALWHMAAGSERISRLTAIGVPAVALPGTTVRMPLSLLTVRGVGPAVLRSPNPRPMYRRMLAQGMGGSDMAAAPAALVDALWLSSRRPQNARSVASLMHAIDRFRRPRAESVLTAQELGAIAAPSTFVLGPDDPYLSIERARRSIAQIPGAKLHEVPGGHAPWLADPERVAQLIARQPA